MNTAFPSFVFLWNACGNFFLMAQHAGLGFPRQHSSNLSSASSAPIGSSARGGYATLRGACEGHKRRKQRIFTNARGRCTPAQLCRLIRKGSVNWAEGLRPARRAARPRTKSTKREENPEKRPHHNRRRCKPESLRGSPLFPYILLRPSFDWALVLFGVGCPPKTMTL